MASTSNLAARSKAGPSEQGGGGRNVQYNCQRMPSGGQSSVPMQQYRPQQAPPMAMPPHSQYTRSHTRMNRVCAQKAPPQRVSEFTARNFTGDKNYDTCG